MITLVDGRVVQGETDWAVFDALTDAEIHAAALADPDAPPQTEEDMRKFRRAADIPGQNFIEKSLALAAEAKGMLLFSIPCDPDVITFFHGREVLVNSVLRAYMEDHQEERQAAQL
jgi:hypothetical protein